MTANRVMATGIVVEEDPDIKGHLHVEVWWRMAGSSATERSVYGGLTWAEAVDVINVELEHHRPGWAIGDGWRMEPLF